MARRFLGRCLAGLLDLPVPVSPRLLRLPVLPPPLPIFFPPHPSPSPLTPPDSACLPLHSPILFLMVPLPPWCCTPVAGNSALIARWLECAVLQFIRCTLLWTVPMSAQDTLVHVAHLSRSSLFPAILFPFVMHSRSPVGCDKLHPLVCTARFHISPQTSLP